MEEPRILQHHTKELPDTAARHLGNVYTIDEDLTTVNIIKSHQEIDQRRLARAGWPNNRHPLARANMSREVLNNWFLGIITKNNVAKLHFAAHHWQRRGGHRVGCFGRFLEKFKDSLGRSCS